MHTDNCKDALKSTLYVLTPRVKRYVSIQNYTALYIGGLLQKEFYNEIPIADTYVKVLSSSAYFEKYNCLPDRLSDITELIIRQPFRYCEELL